MARTIASLSGAGLALVLALAAPVTAQQFGETYDHVWKVSAGRDGHLSVAVPGNYSAGHGCSQPWWARSENSLDDAQTRAMMDIALASQMSRQPVHVTTDGCTSYGHPVLVSIHIQEREAPPTTPPPPRRACPRGQKCCGAIVSGQCVGQCVPETGLCP